MAYRNTPYFVNFNGGLSGINNPGGRVFWVGAQVAADGVGPSDGNSGTSPQQAFATIQKGLDQCASGRGDVVAVLPGTYTITAPITMTNADVTLMSAHPVGPWERSPVVITAAATYDNNVITVDADNCKIIGIEIDCGFTTVTASQEVVQLNSTNTTTDIYGAVIQNCYFHMGRAAGAASAADADLDCIRVGLDANDAAIGTVIRGCVIYGYDEDAISISVGSNGAVIDSNYITDNGATAGSNGVKILALQAMVTNNIIKTGLSSDTDACINVGVAAAIALLVNNRCEAWGANTCAVTVIDTATVFDIGGIYGATAAGNIFDFKTASTTPSTAAVSGAVYAADPAGLAGNLITIAGS